MTKEITGGARSRHSFFDGQRFGRFFSLYMAFNRNRLLGYAAVIIIALIGGALIFPVLTLFTAYNNCTPKTFMDDPSIPFQIVLSIAIIVIGCMLSGSMTFNSLTTKDSRLQAFAVPASQFEKMLTWGIVNLIGFWIVVCIGVCIADAFRVGVTLLFVHDPSRVFSLVIGVCNELSGFDAQDTALLFFFIASALNTQAFFVLGGSVWYRNSFIKTLGFNWIWSNICSALFAAAIGITVIVYGYQDFGEPIDAFFYRFDESIVAPLIWSGTSLVTLFTMFYYWLSYRRFREDGIVFSW